MMTPPPARLLKRRAVEAMTGLSRSSIYRQMENGTFPRPVRTGDRSVAWRVEDVEAWIAELGV